jgi:hypothetical protein
MASRKKSKTRSTAKSSKNVRGRVTKAKTRNKPAKKRSVRKRVAIKPKDKKKAALSTEKEITREFQNRSRTGQSRASAHRSEDFEGLSRSQQADSESVDELVGEGNVFEAGAVAGVQEADEADEKEVHTRELPEDDVPQEYLDKD